MSQTEIVLTDRVEIKSFVEKILKGITSYARKVCPTQENDEGKKVSVDLPIVNNTLFVPVLYAPYAFMGEIKLTEFCIKKCTLRVKLKDFLFQRLIINVDSTNAFITMYKESIKEVIITPTMIKLICIAGHTELTISDEGDYYTRGIAQSIIDKYEDHVKRATAIIGPFEINKDDTADGSIINISSSVIAKAAHFTKNNPDVQFRFKNPMFLSTKAEITVYELSGEEEPSLFLVVSAESATISSKHMFKVLKI